MSKTTENNCTRSGTDDGYGVEHRSASALLYYSTFRLSAYQPTTCVNMHASLRGGHSLPHKAYIENVGWVETSKNVALPYGITPLAFSWPHRVRARGDHIWCPP